MRHTANFGLLALGAALLGVGLPRTARAQEARPESGFWTVDASGGIAVPVASLKDLEKAGPAAGVGLDYWFTPRAALRLDASADFLKGRAATDPGILTGPVPDMTLWNYMGGVELRITPPDASSFDLTADLEVGATTMHSKDSPVFAANGYAGPNFSHTFFTGAAGLRAAYWVTPKLDLFVDGQARLIATSNGATRELVPFSSNVDQGGFEGALALPIQAGLQLVI
jgi:hypothetical protein